MTINEMVDAMYNNLKEVKAIQLEIKYKKPQNMEFFTRCMKHHSEWAFMLTERVIMNHRKAEITSWYKQSLAAVRAAKRVYNA